MSVVPGVPDGVTSGTSTQAGFGWRKWELGDLRVRGFANKMRVSALDIISDSITLLHGALRTTASANFIDLEFALESGAAPFATSFAVQWRASASDAWADWGAPIPVGDFSAADVLRARPTNKIRVFFRDDATRADEAALFADGGAVMDDLGAVGDAVRIAGGGAPIAMRVIATSRRFPQPQPTSEVEVELPGSFPMPAHLRDAIGAVEIVGGAPSFSDSGEPWTAWDELSGVGDLDGSLGDGTGVWKTISNIHVTNSVLLTLAGLEYDPDRTVPDARLIDITTAIPPVFVRFRVGGFSTAFLDASVVAPERASGLIAGEGCLEDPGSTATRRVLMVPVPWCNRSIDVDVVVGNRAFWSLRDVWVEPFTRRGDEKLVPRIGDREVARFLFKRAEGRADTNTEIAPFQEVRAGGAIALAERTYLFRIPANPVLNNIVQLVADQALVEVSGSARCAWASASSGTLVDAIEPTTSSFYRDKFKVELYDAHNARWVDLWAANVGAPFLDPVAGQVRFFDASALALVDASFHDAAHDPTMRATFHRYIGPKVSDLTDPSATLIVGSDTHKAPWSVDNVQAGTVNARVVSWTDVDAELLENTEPVSWSLVARAPFVMTQNVVYQIDGVSATATFVAYENGVIRDLVFDRTLQDGASLGIATFSQSGATLSVFLNDPTASSVVISDIENVNGIGTRGMVQAPLSNTFDATPSINLSIDDVSFASGESDAGGGITFGVALGGDRVWDERVQVEFVAASSTAMPLDAALVPAPDITKIASGAWSVSSLRPAQVYRAIATITNEFYLDVSSETFFSTSASASTDVIVSGAALQVVAGGGSFGAAPVTRDGAALDALGGPDAEFSVALQQAGRMNTSAIMTSNTIVTITLDGVEHQILYDASSGLWGAPAANDNAGASVPAQFLRIDSTAALPWEVCADLAQGDARGVSAAFRVGSQTVITSTIKIGRDSTTSAPDASEAEIELLGPTTTAVGGRTLLSGTFAVSANNISNYAGRFFPSGLAMGSIEGLVPPGGVAVAQTHGSGGASFDDGAMVWTGVASNATVWGPTSSSEHPASLRVTFSSPWGSDAIDFVTNNLFVDNPSLTAFDAWSARKTAPITLTATGASGALLTGAQWLQTPHSTSPVLRGGRFVAVADASALQGFVVRVVDDASGFDATLKISILGSVVGAEHAPPVPNAFGEGDVSGAGLRVFVSASAEGVAGALSWSDANEVAAFPSDWSSGGASSCLAHDTISTNTTRYVVLPAAFESADVKKTVDVGIVFASGFLYDISDVAVDATFEVCI